MRFKMDILSILRKYSSTSCDIFRGESRMSGFANALPLSCFSLLGSARLTFTCGCLVVGYICPQNSHRSDPIKVSIFIARRFAFKRASAKNVVVDFLCLPCCVGLLAFWAGLLLQHCSSHVRLAAVGPCLPCAWWLRRVWVTPGVAMGWLACIPVFSRRGAALNAGPGPDGVPGFPMLGMTAVV